MKNKKTIITASLFAAAAVSAQAATTILIDYDDGTAGNGIHDAAINNGGFETTTGAGTVPDPFVLVDWVAVGDKDLQVLSNLASPIGGNNTVIGRQGGFISPGQNTGHVLALGDQFSGSYGWRDAFGWAAGETIGVTLYYTTDNLIGGAPTSLFTFNSGNEAANNTWETETLALTAGVTDAGAVGKTLFIAFEGNNLSDGSFARFDNVYLDVTAVPEPSTTALLGLAGLALILRRRK